MYKAIVFFAGGMAASENVRVPFTATQWQELERQAMAYKYMMASVPVPPQLLIPFTKSPSNVAHSHSNCKNLIILVFFLSICLLFPYKKATICCNGFFFSFVQMETVVLGKWGSQTTRIQSHGGVGEQMGRNGGARETQRSIRNTVSDTHTKTVPVQDSLWNQKPNSSITTTKSTIMPLPSLIKSLIFLTGHVTTIHLLQPWSLSLQHHVNHPGGSVGVSMLSLSALNLRT